MTTFRPNGYSKLDRPMPLYAERAGYEFYVKGSDSVVVLNDGGHRVVVEEWASDASMTDLWSAIEKDARERGIPVWRPL